MNSYNENYENIKNYSTIISEFIDKKIPCKIIEKFI